MPVDAAEARKTGGGPASSELATDLLSFCCCCRLRGPAFSGRRNRGDNTIQSKDLDIHPIRQRDLLRSLVIPSDGETIRSRTT